MLCICGASLAGSTPPIAAAGGPGSGAGDSRDHRERRRSHGPSGRRDRGLF